MVKKEFYTCPHCGKKLVRVGKIAICKGIYILCRKCGKEVEISILSQQDNR